MLSEKIPDYAKDIKLNLNSLLEGEGAQGLSSNQALATALACAHAVRNLELVHGILELGAGKLSDAEVESAKTAAVIMAMNNVYYRFTHICEDQDIAKMPARLRMNAIGKPLVSKLDFELYCLAVSAVNNCSLCMNSHLKTLKSHGLSNEGIQSAVRIAATINAANAALFVF